MLFNAVAEAKVLPPFCAAKIVYNKDIQLEETL